MPQSISDDLMAPEVILDPHGYYRGIREQDPIHWNDRWGGWILTRYDDVVQVLRDWERFSSDRIGFLADELPDGVYSDAEAAIVKYAQRSTRLEPIDDELYAALSRHFSKEQLIDLCLTVGLSNMINRFHATFRTDVDGVTLSEAEAGDVAHGACPLPRPRPPAS